MELVEESEQDMDVVEEGDSHLEEAEEAKMTSEGQVLEVKTEDTQEQMDLGKEGLIKEVKVEEESGAHEQKEEEKEKVIGKIPGKPSEEKPDDDKLKSTTQAKQKARERIKEGELLYLLFVFSIKK